MNADLARAVWHRLEIVNAVAYFSQECRDASTHLGLKGFWMGYFASRAAPMGPVGPGVVEATFYNFHPDRVRRAVPDAWALAEPPAIVAARSNAAAEAIRRILGDTDAETLAALVRPVAHEAIDRAGGEGRPLFAANREVAEPRDPVDALWQAATTLREHRGDGHVAVLTSVALDGCAAHVLFAATENVPATLYLESRGWSLDDWAAASARLAERGLLDGNGSPTAAGRELRQTIEQRTDELAGAPYEAIGVDRIEALLSDVDPIVRRIASTGEITFPNPMGLPSQQR
ncbi:MAG: hypothetical protein AAGF73_02415 [Actinomycetota bacterium]